MKKLIILLAAAIIIIAVYLLFFNPDSTVNPKETDFAIKNPNSVDSFMIIKDYDTIILSRNGKQWFVNHRTAANDKHIKKALLTLQMLEVKTPVPNNALNFVNKKLQKALRIVIFTSNAKKTILLGEATQNKEGNFAKIDTFSPYIIYIPSHNFDLRLNFKPDFTYWETNSIFKFNPEQITYIDLKYPHNPQQSFTLKKVKNDFLLYENGKSYKNLNKENLSFYLTHFQDVRYKKILKDTSLFDAHNLFFEIEVRDNKGYDVKLKGYKIPNNNDEFIGQVNGKKVLCKYYDFDLILKNADYFIQK